MNTQKQQYLYTVILQESSRQEYAHLRIEIRRHDTARPSITLAWQANRTCEEGHGGCWREGWTDFYAMDLELDVHDLEGLEECTKVARRVLKFAQPWARPTANDVMAYLAKHKGTFVEAIYDARESRYIPLDEVKPTSYTCYVDDNHKTGEDCPTVSVLARNTEEAQKAIIITMAEGGYNPQLEKFIQMGKPVRTLECMAPDDLRPAVIRFCVPGYVPQPEQQALDLDE